MDFKTTDKSTDLSSYDLSAEWSVVNDNDIDWSVLNTHTDWSIINGIRITVNY